MTIYILFALLIVPPAAVAAWWCACRYQPRTQRTSLHGRDMLHRDAQAMYLRLRAALPQYLIFARANLSAFIEVRGSSKPAISARRAELARESADFLICSSDFRVVAAVELEDIVNGRSPSDRSGILLRAAEIPMLRWTTVSLPTIRDIQEAVAELETMRLLRLGMEARDLDEAPRDAGMAQRAGVNRRFKT